MTQAQSLFEGGYLPQEQPAVHPFSASVNGAANTSLGLPTYSGGPKYKGYTLARWETDASLIPECSAGKAWTDEDEEFIIHHHHLGVPYRRVHKVVGRTLLALRLKICKISKRTRKPKATKAPPATKIVKSQKPKFNGHSANVQPRKTGVGKSPLKDLSSVPPPPNTQAPSSSQSAIGSIQGVVANVASHSADLPESQASSSTTDDIEVTSPLESLQISNGAEKKCTCYSGGPIYVNHHGATARCESYQAVQKSKRTQ